MITRRSFLFSCSATATIFVVAPMSSPGYATVAGEGFQSLDQMSYPMLAAQVNTPFRVYHSSGRVVELQLIKAPLATSRVARQGRHFRGDAGHEKFSLIFRGSKAELIEPAIHRFEHAQLGRFEMYIGRVGTENPDRVRYESVFNRPGKRAQA
jgi:hypothetical protein